MSTDQTPKRRKPPTERLHLVVQRAVYARIVMAAALEDDSVSGFLAKQAAAAAEKVLAERGVCPSCRRPHDAERTQKTVAA